MRSVVRSHQVGIAWFYAAWHQCSDLHERVYEIIGDDGPAALAIVNDCVQNIKECVEKYIMHVIQLRRTQNKYNEWRLELIQKDQEEQKRLEEAIEEEK